MEVKYTHGQIVTLEQMFAGFAQSDQRKIFMAGFRRAARPLVSAAKAGAPRDTGTLQSSIGALSIRRDIAILVGARKRRGGWYGHFVEKGTRERIRRSGGSTGRIIGRRFFETAYNATEPAVIGSIESEWHRAIDRHIIRAKKKLALQRAMEQTKTLTR